MWYNIDTIKKEINTKESQQMIVKVKVYNMCKYNSKSEKIAEVEYNPIKIEVVKIPDEQIYAMGFDELDEYGEYLIMTHGDGETSTFRNSHVDVFRIE